MAPMANILDVSTAAKRFRLISMWEAVTWAALLVSMVFKWGFGYEEAVKIPGMIHGFTGFILYVVIAFFTARSLKWDFKTLVLALVSSVPPFMTIWFERRMARTGQLGELSVGAAGQPDERTPAPTH